MDLTMLSFPMMFDVFTKKFSANDVCRLAVTHGIRKLDVLELELKLIGLANMLKAMQENGVQINSLVAIIPFLTEKETAIINKLQQSIDLASKLGTRLLMIVPFASCSRSKLKKMDPAVKRDRLVRYFTIAVQMAKAQDIQVCMEDTPFLGASLSRITDCKALLEKVPELGLVFDTGNMIPSGDDPIEFYQHLKQYICHVHLKDVIFMKKGKMTDETSDGRHIGACVFSEGIIPLSEIIDQLKADGYTGTVSLEYCRPAGKGKYENHALQLDKFLAYWENPIPTPGGTLQMRKDKVFGWAFIGTGYQAKQAAGKIIPTGHHKIITVFTRNFAKAHAFADKHGARACKTMQEAVLAEGVDGVYIATTANSHYEIAKSCLEMGKPILLEKPFTASQQQAVELVTLARKKNLYLAEAMWTWFSPVARQVKTWIDNGEVGKIEHIKLTYAMPAAFFFRRLNDPCKAGGALLDCGIYPITYCYNLFGQPTQIECHGTLKDGVDQEEEVILTQADGLRITILISMVRFKGEELVIIGDKGTITNAFYHESGKTTLVRKNGRKIEFKGYGGVDNEFNLVAEEILNGQIESHFVPLQATLANLGTLDECRRQIGLVYPFETTAS